MKVIDKIKDLIFKIKDYDRLESDYCTVLDMVTGARLSKPNYKMDSIREAFNEFLDEHDKEVDAIEREVKEDAGGYPYIDATELYDYNNDKPLAKAGDKVKVLIIKDK